MNISTKIVALMIAAQIASGVVLAKFEYVAMNRQELLQNSKKGKQLRAELQTQANELQTEQQKLIAGVQDAEKEFQKKAIAMNKSTQEAEIAKLRKKASKVQTQIQEMTAEFNELAESRQKALDEENIQFASALLQEKEWGMLVDKNAALALNPALDKTNEILARIDAEFDKAQAFNQIDAPVMVA
jgi:Skp family chaperone for outer membrane proteins